MVPPALGSNQTVLTTNMYAAMGQLKQHVGCLSTHLCMRIVLTPSTAVSAPFGVYLALTPASLGYPRPYLYHEPNRSPQRELAALAQAAQRGTAAQAEAADARQRLASDLRIAEGVAARQARELGDRDREIGTLRNKVRSGQSWTSQKQG